MLNFIQKRKLKPSLRRIVYFKNAKKPIITKVYQSLGGTLGKKTNRAILTTCFYHDDENPSMALYDDSGTFYCFTCATFGNAYQLIIDKRGMTFKEAAHYCEENNLYE